MIINDGDRLTFGNNDHRVPRVARAHAWKFSFFWNVYGDDGRVLRAGTMGGAGMNTIASKYIHEYHLKAEDWRGRFMETLIKCRDQHCDIFIGNHVGQNDTPGKYKRLLAGEKDAFINPAEWASPSIASSAATTRPSPKTRCDAGGFCQSQSCRGSQDGSCGMAWYWTGSFHRNEMDYGAAGASIADGSVIIGAGVVRS